MLYLAKRRLINGGGVDDSYSSSRQNRRSIDGIPQHSHHASSSVRTSIDNPPSLTAPSQSSEERDLPETPRSPSFDAHQLNSAVPVSSKLPLYKESGKDNSIFEHARRVPSSPMNLSTTPRKPKPPGRHRAAARPQAYFDSTAQSTSRSRTEDDHSQLSFEHQNSRRLNIDYDRNRKDKHRLSRSLEEEMLDVDEQTMEEFEDLEESGTLSGVGSRDLRGGFLARGGGGGEPMLLGEGSVRGYEGNGGSQMRTHAKSRKATQR